MQRSHLKQVTWLNIFIVFYEKRRSSKAALFYILKILVPQNLK